MLQSLDGFLRKRRKLLEYRKTLYRYPIALASGVQAERDKVAGVLAGRRLDFNDWKWL